MGAEEKFGLPRVLIDFKTKGVTAIKRSARGIVVMILKNESTDTINTWKIKDVSDIPSTGIKAENIEYIKACLLGSPYKILVYGIPDSTALSAKKKQADVLKLIQNVKWNWICAPTGDSTDQSDLASWVKSERTNNRKTFKAVVAKVASDNMGVVNFTTGGIKVQNGESLGKPTYKTYTAAEYTARIAGILAGLALDRSATYYKLTEVESCDVYDDIDSNIDKGELVLFDEEDGDGVKIARACNSLTTFTTDVGETFRKIKIVEAIDMIQDDIRDTFKKFYVGKIINDYNHKMLLIAAIKVYFSEIAGNVLDASANNTVDIDEQFQKNKAILNGEDVEKMNLMDIRKYNTGSEVALVGNIKPVDAMEDLKVVFTL